MVEFTAVVEDGIVRIPASYKKKLNNKLVTIILPTSVASTPRARRKSAYGALAKYADPRKRKLEKHAWAMAVKEKYGLR